MVIKMFLKIKSEDLWKFLPVLFFIFFISPVALVLSSLFGQYSENWSHLYNYVLSDYIINSFLLITGVSILTSVIGIITSWLVTNFNFSGKKFFEWALILPLSVPPYILAYTYTGLFDASGSANTFLIEIFNLDKSTIIFPNIRNIYGAVTVFLSLIHI